MKEFGFASTALLARKLQSDKKAGSIDYDTPYSLQSNRIACETSPYRRSMQFHSSRRCIPGVACDRRRVIGIQVQANKIIGQ